MGIIQVAGPQTGKNYSINISGDQPTETEQQRIDQFVAQKEQAYADFLSRYEAPVIEEAEEEVEDPKGGFVNAMGVGLDALQVAYGNTLERIGANTGIAGLQDYGTSVIEANEQQIAEKSEGLTRREDIETFGDAASFFFETLGQQVPQLGVSLGGAGAGALAAAPIPIPGARVVGGLIGGIAANYPYFFGDNIAAQKDAIDRGLRVEIDDSAAALAAIPQAALDSIVDRLLIGKILNPSVIRTGGIFTRAGKGAAAGTVAEVPTEIGQEVINRYQAGLPIDDEEAFKVYEDVAIAAGITGGTVRGVTNVVGGDYRKEKARKDEAEKLKQLADDQSEENARSVANVDRIKDAQQKETDESLIEGRDTSPIPAERSLAVQPEETSRLEPQEEISLLGQAAREATLPYVPVPLSALPVRERQAIRQSRYAQGIDTDTDVSVDEIRRVIGEEAAIRESAKQKPVTGGDSRFQPIDSEVFTQEQYDAAVDQVRAQKKYTVPAIRKGLYASGQKTAPNSQVQAIRDEMVRRGVLRKSEKSKNGYEIEPDIASANNETASYIKTISDIDKQIAKTKRSRTEALEKARRIEQDPALDLTPRQRAQQSRELKLEADNFEAQIAQAEQNKTEIENRRKQGPTSSVLPTTETPKIIMGTDRLDPNASSSERIDALRTSIAGYDAQIAEQKKNLAALKRQTKKINLPKSDQGLITEIEKDIERKTYLREAAQSRLDKPSAPVQVAPEKTQAAIAREVANKAANANKRDAFTQRQSNLIASLSKRLKRMGLSDVRLIGEKLVAPELLKEGKFAEGVYTVKDGNKILALSMEAVDPSKPVEEQYNVLKSVMNHEVIHALKNLGLFTDEEYNSLVKAAKSRKYVAIKDGKPTERKYTYFERAEAMYQGMGLNNIGIEEEAVAELFRDYADGKIKLAGRPKTLFERIKNFFTSVFKATKDAGFNDVEDIFENVRSGEIGRRERAKTPLDNLKDLQAQAGSDVDQQAQAFSLKTFYPKLPFAPEGVRAHNLPHQLLVEGDGTPPQVKITKKYTPKNAAANNSSIEQIIAEHPDALLSDAKWLQAMQAALGGDYLPAPPLVGIEYSKSPEAMAEKLRQLTPELRKGVDEGFNYVNQIRDIYYSGQATPRMTMDLFVWGILSRGAGPVQQESAFIDIIDSAYPILEKATRQPLSPDDVDMWMNGISTKLPEGSPGKQVTMNVNAAGRLVNAMSQMVGDTNRTVIDLIHEGMSDPNVPASDIRQLFMSATQGAGIDNKVLSFILLVGGKDDVLVMDRIQGRALWDDGRYGGANIYDGIGKNKEGLSAIVRGPVGNLVTRLLENGMRKNVERAYELVGRPQDASLGRWHWETWVIEGEQVVSHGTLQAVINGSPIGTSVTEGKTDTFSSGMTYIRGENATVVEYPLSDGTSVYMSPTQMKEFEAYIRNAKNGIVPKGFKVTERADIPWYTRAEVDREKLDQAAREFENAKPNGSILRRDERSGENKDASRRGNSPIDKRYGSNPDIRSQQGGGRRGRDQTGSLAPLEGAPTVRGASGPDENLVAVAERYARDNGIDLKRQSEFVAVDESRATRIAQAYEEMENAPQDPVVREAYENLIVQTIDQYRALENAGYKFWFTDLSIPDNIEYLSSPWNAMRDIRANKTMGIFPTDEGFGSSDLDVSNNPMLMDTGIEWPSGSPNGPKKKVLANDLFRAVHDAFGHGLEGSGFRARGEENAWQAHVRLFTGSAVGAITSETRGQNSWLNYGPYGEQNRNAKVEDTIFADQKVGLMPAFTWEEGRAGDADISPEQESSIEPSAEDDLPSGVREQFKSIVGDSTVQEVNKFSVAPSDPNQLIAAPKKNKDGSTSPIYGTMLEDGKPIPVILKAGNHKEVRGFAPTGTGLYHIQQRGHDRELERFSRYYKSGKDIKQAIYDTLVKLKNQNYQDGADMLVTPQGRNRLVLEWRENIPYKSPPLTLVLEKKPLGSGSVYEVVTFFPDLEKKNRAVVDGRTRYSIVSAVDSGQLFDQQALQDAARQNDKSREILTYVSINDFLNVAEEGRDERKEQAVKQLVSEGTKFNSIPYLGFINNGDGTGQVVGHEGRHRARALADLGYEDMPVRIVSEQGGNGPSIRWGQQDDPSNMDYVPVDQRPNVLLGETSGQMAMPDLTFNNATTSKYSVTQTTPATQLAKDVKQKEYNLNYAKAADFLAKPFNLFMPRDVAQERADDILRKFQDSMLPVGRMVQELKQAGLKITDAMDTYLNEELFHRKTANEVEKRQNTTYKEAVEAGKQIKATDAQIKDLKAKSGFFSQALASSNAGMAMVDAYLYASHAKERNAYIEANKDANNSEGSGMSNDEADTILQWFANLDSNSITAVSDLDAAVKNIVADTNSLRVDAGLIPRDFVEIEDDEGNLVPAPNYSSYVPLRGIYDPEKTDDLDYTRPSMRGAFGVRGREDRKARGRTADVGYATDILANVISQNQNAVVRGERNKVGQSFLKLLRGDEETGTSLTSGYAQILDKLPTTRRQGRDAQGRPIMVNVPNIMKLTSDPSVLAVKEDGKDVFVRIYDPRIAQAMKGATGLGDSSQSTILRGMTKFNRLLSNINTSYNPEFLITNMLRDLQTAGVNINQYDEKGLTSSILKGLAPALRGIKSSIRDNDNSSDWAKIYRDFVDAGGKNATNQMNTVADEMENLTKLLSEIGDAGSAGKWGLVKNKFLGKGKSLLQFMEDYNTIVENGIRVSTYQSLLDKGFTRERAAQAAGNVTVNFSKGGEYKGLMNAMYLFYNASLQGSFAMLNAAVRSKRVQKIWMYVVAAGVLQDQLNAALSEEDEDGKLVYDKIPPYLLEHNIILPDPFGLVERPYIKIPMPYGLNMAHNLGRAMSQVARGGESVSDAANSIVGTIVDTLSPIGGIYEEGVVDAVAPTIADPFIDIFRNKNFANNPIYKEGFPGERTPASQQYWSTTSPSAKWIASNLNSLTGGTAATKGLVDISPDVMEYWFEFLTGGVGRFVQRTAELPARVYEDGLTEDLIGEVPFVRKVIGSVTDRQDLGTYIEKRDRVLRAFDEIRDASKKQDAPRLAKARQNYSEEIKYIQLVRNIENARRKLSQQINAVRDNERLSDERKQELLDTLEDRRNAVVLRASKLMKDFK